MDVGRNQLMEHILELAEILLNVLLDGFHLLLGVDFGITEFSSSCVSSLSEWSQLSSSGSPFIGS